MCLSASVLSLSLIEPMNARRTNTQVEKFQKMNFHWVFAYVIELISLVTRRESVYLIWVDEII